MPDDLTAKVCRWQVVAPVAAGARITDARRWRAGGARLATSTSGRVSATVPVSTLRFDGGGPRFARRARLRWRTAGASSSRSGVARRGLSAAAPARGSCLARAGGSGRSSSRVAGAAAPRSSRHRTAGARHIADHHRARASWTRASAARWRRLLRHVARARPDENPQSQQPVHDHKA